MLQSLECMKLLRIRLSQGYFTESVSSMLPMEALIRSILSNSSLRPRTRRCGPCFCSCILVVVIIVFFLLLSLFFFLLLILSKPNITQLNSKQLKSNFVGFDIVLTWNPHHTTHPTPPQTFQALLDQLES